MSRINIIITDTKESERFPGKNDRLAEYTFEWLLDEIQDFSTSENVHLWYILREGKGFKSHFNLDTCHIVFSPDDPTSDSHKPLLKWFEEKYGKPKDTFILLQLSQPLRRRGLLREVVDAVTQDNVVLTYTMWGSSHWRIVDNGTMEHDDERQDDIHRFYDGAVYAWQGSSGKIFDLRSQSKVWVKNYTGPVCDIDHPWEYNKEYLDGLEELARQNERLGK